MKIHFTKKNIHILTILLMILTFILITTITIFTVQTIQENNLFISTKRILLEAIDEGDVFKTKQSYEELLSEIKEDDFFLEELRESVTSNTLIYLFDNNQENRKIISKYLHSYIDDKDIFDHLDQKYVLLLNEKTTHSSFIEECELIEKIIGYNDRLMEQKNNADLLHQSRQHFNKALELFKSHEYLASIDYFNKVNPMDILYYPESQSKIQQAIENLCEQIRFDSII